MLAYCGRGRFAASAEQAIQTVGYCRGYLLLLRPKANNYSYIWSERMIRRVFGVGLYIAAGHFFFLVSMWAFIDDAVLGANHAAFAKWPQIIRFTVPAVLTLVAGLAIMGFQDWRWDAGVVLLSTAGLTTLMAFWLASILIQEELRKIKMMPPMMPPDSVLRFFSDYITGAATIVVLALAGAVLVLTSSSLERWRKGTHSILTCRANVSRTRQDCRVR